MKKLFLPLALLSFASASYAGTYVAYGQNNQTRKDYYNEWGQHQGYSKLEPYSGKTTHYNEWGQSQGYSKRDSYSGTVKHYNEWGQLQGTTR